MAKRNLAVGLMSGTSADGITAALVDLRSGCRVLHCRTFPYPKDVRKEVLAARNLQTAALSRLNMRLGFLFAEAALKILGKDRARAIGSHGQTVWHGPDEKPANTFQIAEPSVIAEKTRTTVVADFRPRDIAAGGQGAPLISAFDEFLFSKGPLRAVFNIGGIANVSIVGKSRLWSSFDTGPGNALIDAAVAFVTRGKDNMDKSGHWAKKGRIDHEKVAALLRDPFFQRRPPKSLEKSLFSEDFLKRHFSPLTLKRLPNIAATLSALTALSMAEACRRFSPGKIKEVILSGGGVKNPFLLRQIEKAFSPVPVVLSNRYGMDVMAKEAACFAWLADRALRGFPNNCPQATGAQGPRILGKIIPA